MPSWKKVVVSGSDATLNSLFVSTAVTASRFSGSFTGSLLGTASYVSGSVFTSNNLALSASYAITASYALNGGGGNSTITVADETVIQGTANYFKFTGNAVTATVSSNTASILIEAAQGTGSVALHTQASPAVTWSFNHDLNNTYPVLNVWDTAGFTIIPGGIKSVDSNNIEIYFDIAQAGYASAVVGGSALSASVAITSSYALTASYALNSSAGASDFPYTGSAIISGSLTITGSLSISGAINPVDYIQFNTTSSVTDAVGRLYFDQGEGVLQYTLNNGNVIARIGEDLYQYAYNAQGSPMTKGQVVYISGSQGNRIAVKLASNQAELGSSNVLGFVAENISTGADGWVQTNGVLRKLDTTGLTAGKLIFLSSTPGAYTQSFPQAPSHSVRLGFPERIDATVGSIYIKIDNGYETDELHDVAISGSTTGDLLVRSGSIWVNSKQFTGSYGLTGSFNITGSVNANGGFTGSLLGTASYVTGSIYVAGNLATSASYAITSSNANTASRVTSDLTQGTGITAFTYNGSSPQTVAVAGASTLTTNELTKWNGTAFADSNIFDNGTSVFITASTVIVSGASSALIVTGSIRSSAGFTGSLLGTASYASQAATASFAFYITGSGTTNRHSKFTANNAIGDSLIFDDGTNLQITGSTIIVSGASTAFIVTGSVRASAGFTGSLLGTASYASQAATASFAFYITGSGTTNRHSKFTAGNTIGDSLILDDGTNVQITGSTIIVSGASTAFIVTGSVRASSGFTGSLLGTASYSAQAATASFAFYITGSGTTNRHSKFTAGNTIGDSLIFDDGTNLQITGSSIIVSGSSTALIVTGSVRSSAGFTGSLLGTASYAAQAATASFAFYITGSGTTNRHSKFTAANTIGDSNILDDGTNLQITGSSIIVSGASTAFIVTGSVRSSGGFTGSLFGTASFVSGNIFVGSNIATSASYAITASYALTSSFSVTSSYALTSSFALTSSYSVTASYALVSSAFPFTGSARITGSLDVTGSFSVSGSTAINTQQNATINIGTSVVATLPTASMYAAFFDYIARSGSATQNMRAGTVMSVWNTLGTVQYTDNSTPDIGDTSGVTFAVVANASNVELRATVTTDSWNIKTFVRSI